VNAAEEIVRYWIQECQGFFTQDSVSLPRNKEIDLLAIHRDERKWHVEIQVAVRYANYKSNAAELAEDFNKRKFEDSTVKAAVIERLGEEYEKKCVIGRVYLRDNDIRDEFIKECSAHNVDVILFDDVMHEVAVSLGTRSHLNQVIRTIQLVDEFNTTLIETGTKT
jgi:hypothetical protein